MGVVEAVSISYEHISKGFTTAIYFGKQQFQKIKEDNVYE